MDVKEAVAKVFLELLSSNARLKRKYQKVIDEDAYQFMSNHYPFTITCVKCSLKMQDYRSDYNLEQGMILTSKFEDMVNSSPNSARVFLAIDCVKCYIEGIKKLCTNTDLYSYLEDHRSNNLVDSIKSAGFQDMEFVYFMYGNFAEFLNRFGPEYSRYLTATCCHDLFLDPEIHQKEGNRISVKIAEEILKAGYKNHLSMHDMHLLSAAPMIYRYNSDFYDTMLCLDRDTILTDEKREYLQSILDWRIKFYDTIGDYIDTADIRDQMLAVFNPKQFEKESDDNKIKYYSDSLAKLIEKTGLDWITLIDMFQQSVPTVYRSIPLRNKMDQHWNDFLATF